MDKEQILREIKRTAKENGGKPLGHRKFIKETGITEYTWELYWDTWSHALKEAGFEPNQFFRAHSHETLVEKFIELINELGQFPLKRQIAKKARTEPQRYFFRPSGTCFLLSLYSQR